jgi:hypothetical protein
MHLLNGGEISTSVLDEDSLGNAGTITVGADLAALNGGVIQVNGVIGRGGGMSPARAVGRFGRRGAFRAWPSCGERAGGGGGTFASTGRARLPEGPDAPILTGYSTTAGPLAISRSSYSAAGGC